MIHLFIYMLKSALLLALLWGIYRLALRRETFHGFNRAVLLGIMAVSLVLPALTFSTASPGVASVAVAKAEEWLLVPVVSPSGVPEQPEAFSFRSLLPGLAGGVYVVGLVVALLRYALQYVALYRLFRRSRRVDDIGGLRIYINDELVSPISWMHRIVLSGADYREQRMGLLDHEAAHARGCHTFDLIAAGLLGCLQWFNPFMRYFRQDLRAVHEFLADRAAAASGIAGEAYQLLLIKKAVAGRTGLSAAHSLTACPVKRRLTMMYAKPSRRAAALKVLLFLPAVVLAVSAFAKPEMVQALSLEEEKRAVVSKPSAAENEPVEIISEAAAPDMLDAIGEKLLKEIIEKLAYPEKARKENVHGVVVCKFRVNEKGEAGDISIERSLSPECDQAVIDVVKRLSAETLLQCRSQHNDAYISIPVRFRIN